MTPISTFGQTLLPGFPWRRPPVRDLSVFHETRRVLSSNRSRGSIARLHKQDRILAGHYTPGYDARIFIVNFAAMPADPAGTIVARRNLGNDVSGRNPNKIPLDGGVVS